MYKKIILLFIVVSSLALQNCDKGGGDPVPDPIVAPTITIPTAINGVDGILVAILTSTKNSGVETKIGSASAVFYKSKSPATNYEAGVVKINTKATTKSDNNTYFFTISTTDPNGIVFGSQVYWQVSGNATNDIPAIDNNDGTGMPNIPITPEFINMNKDQDYNLNWSSSFGGDSVALILKGPSATYKKVFNNTVSSHLIPKAEIAKLGAGSGNLQLINYKLSFKTVGTKNYAFLKQSVGVCSKLGIVQ